MRPVRGWRHICWICHIRLSALAEPRVAIAVIKAAGRYAAHPSAPPGVTPEYLTGGAQAMAWFRKERAVLLAADKMAAEIG